MRTRGSPAPSKTPECSTPPRARFTSLVAQLCSEVGFLTFTLYATFESCHRLRLRHVFSRLLLTDSVYPHTNFASKLMWRYTVPVALLADGSYRDAQGILQKVMGTSADAKITLAEVENITGAPKRALVNSVIEALEKKNAATGLSAIQKAVEQNVDIKIFSKLLLAKLRFILLLRNAPEMEKTIREEVSTEDLELLKKIASSKDSRINSVALLEFLNAYDLIGYAALPQLPLELAFIKLTQSQ